jgi:glycerol kinase
MAQREFRQIYPQPGWVEHDPDEIWAASSPPRARRWQGGPGGSDISADRHHQPARDDACGTAAPASRVHNAIVLAGPRG